MRIIAGRAAAWIGAFAVALSASGAMCAEGTDSTLGGPSVRGEAHASPADRETAKRVADALHADNVNFYRHVTVDVKNGVVTLGGKVGTTSAITNAKKIAQNVEGVSKVVSQLKLRTEESDQGGADSAH